MKKYILFCITLFLLILAFTLSAQFIDFDLWARLIAGMGVIDGGQVLKQDFLSYTPVHTWYDHEWGSGVVFYAILKLFGPAGIILLQSLLAFLIFFIASKVIKVRTGITDYNILFFFFAFMAAMENLNHPVRCHMFSFLLFTLFIYILEKVRHGANNKLLILLPILTILWNNLHGGVVAGLGLIGMYFAGEILNRKPYKKYLFTLIASICTLVINPWGFDYIKFLLHATTMERPRIGEWQGLFSFLHKGKYINFKILLCLVFGFEIFNIFKALKNTKVVEFYHKLDKVKILVLFVTLALAIKHIKMIPFCCIAVTCYCYEDMEWLFNKINQKAIYILLILISAFTISVKKFELPINFLTYPVTEVEFIKINNIKGTILTEFGKGSYTAYKLYPNNKIFMDGRYEEVYPDEMVEFTYKFYASTAGWDDVLVQYPPDIVLVRTIYPAFNLMKKHKDYHLIFVGNSCGVFIKNSMYKGEYQQPPMTREYYKNTLFDTNIKFSR